MNEPILEIKKDFPRETLYSTGTEEAAYRMLNGILIPLEAVA